MYFCTVMLTKTRALVLRSLKYGDTKIIVDLLTESEGRVSVIVNIPKSSKGKLKKQFFQPLTLLEAELDIRPKVQLQKLRDVRLSLPFSTLNTEPRKLSVALFLAEFLLNATRGEHDNPALFAYVANGLEWFDACRESYANFHLVFMMRLTRFVGFYPNTEDYHEGDFFDLQASCFCHAAPLHSDFLQPADAALIQPLLRMNYESMHLFRLSHQQRNRVVDIILRYYQLHVPGFTELNSLEVVRDLWG